MRVITGVARGKNLYTPPGIDVRPTAQRVKEAIFSAIQFHIPGARVLDLFAGSGQMGIEAISRGASSVTFVDGSDESIRTIRKNLESTALVGCAKVTKADSFRFLARLQNQFDIIFIDPPYGLGLAKKALRRSSEHLAPGGFIICETEQKAGMPEKEGGIALYKKYRYGQTDIRIYRNSADVGEEE